MPSRKFTLYLVMIASLVGGLAGIRLVQQDLGVIFGFPPRQAGQVLYEDFDLEDVHTVSADSHACSAPSWPPVTNSPSS